MASTGRGVIDSEHAVAMDLIREEIKAKGPLCNCQREDE
jgi:hypothetical protein